MIKKIKKLLGICEHSWTLVNCSTTILWYERDRYDALQFTVQIICENCGTHKMVESEYFDKCSISPNYRSLEGTSHWINPDDCKEVLIKTVNAKIVWTSCAIKCKNKYGINFKEGKDF
jgi:hypothetical protein